MLVYTNRQTGKVVGTIETPAVNINLRAWIGQSEKCMQMMHLKFILSK
jgi:hypothetical protein